MQVPAPGPPPPAVLAAACCRAAATPWAAAPASAPALSRSSLPLHQRRRLPGPTPCPRHTPGHGGARGRRGVQTAPTVQADCRRTAEARQQPDDGDAEEGSTATGSSAAHRSKRIDAASGGCESFPPPRHPERHILRVCVRLVLASDPVQASENGRRAADCSGRTAG